MPKKAATPPPRDIEFGIGWEKHPTHTMPPTLLRSLVRRTFCARHNIVSANPDDAVSRFEHRREIIRTLWPNFVWHDWADRMLMNLSEHHFTTWLGPAASGKTSVAAVAALEWWLEDPGNSAVIVCSTTMNMLRRRIWGEIVSWHSKLPAEAKVGELLDTACFIRVRDGDYKNGIKGIAIQDGPIEQAVADIVGMHTKRVWVLLDEAQEVREAIMEARHNLQANPESRMHLMGNPESFTSLLCRFGAPKDGWDSIPKFTPEWETKAWGYEGKGQAIFFDGRDSPAVRDPAFAKKHDWMINSKMIQKSLEDFDGNENDPRFMSQRIGWPPSMGLESTILDMALVNTFHCQRASVWTHGKTQCGSLDPAFAGGDKAVITFGHRGWVDDDQGKRWVISPEEQITISLDAESDRAIHYQLLDRCRAECQKRNIPPDEFAVAAAGEGGGLVSIMRQEWGPVIGIEEGGSPSERIVGAMGKTAKEYYDTKASELAFGLREFAQSNGLRGLPDEVVSQACKRLTFNRRGKWCVESKSVSKGQVDDAGRPMKGFKSRLGKSPDEFDSAMIFVEHCRLKGAEPGKSMAPKTKQDRQQELQEVDAMYGDGFTQPEDWRALAHAS